MDKAKGLILIKQLFKAPVRIFSSNSEIQPIVTNRNPRNLERLRIARKPVGFYLDNKKVEYWHKLIIDVSNRNVKASLIHNTNIVAVTASTSETCLKSFLYSGNDTTAYVTLAKVFAERCLESGITSCFCEIEPVPESKIHQFLKTVEKEGLSLKEPDVFNIHHIWHKQPEKKPWLVFED